MKYGIRWCYLKYAEILLCYTSYSHSIFGPASFVFYQILFSLTVILKMQSGAPFHDSSDGHIKY